MNFTSIKINPAVWGTCIVLLMLPELLMLDTKAWWDAPVVIVLISSSMAFSLGCSAAWRR